MTDPGYRPSFTERESGAGPPSQLELRQVSKQLRALLWGAVYKDMQTCVGNLYGTPYVQGRWQVILLDFHVQVENAMADEFSHGASDHTARWRRLFENGAYGSIFNGLEFILQHKECSSALRDEVTKAFITARAAYRVIDGDTIAAIGSPEEGEAITAALRAATDARLGGCRAHLKQATVELRAGRWANAVRESIHAVESAAVVLAPGTQVLGPALTALDKGGHLHGGMRAAFSSLYGYTSEEKGVRHAIIMGDEAKVDEADALFMVGACASFVSYLIAKGRAAGLISGNL